MTFSKGHHTVEAVQYSRFLWDIIIVSKIGQRRSNIGTLVPLTCIFKENLEPVWT